MQYTDLQSNKTTTTSPYIQTWMVEDKRMSWCRNRLMKLSSVSHRCKKQTWRPPQLSCTECSDRGIPSASLSSCSFLHFCGDHQAQDSLQCKSLHAWTLPHFHQLGLGSKHGMPYLRMIFLIYFFKSMTQVQTEVRTLPLWNFFHQNRLPSQKL